jgi:DUF971 family protein
MMIPNTQSPTHRPADLAVDRSAGLLRVAWHDGHRSEYALTWLRANCPCASCREERRERALNTDLLKLNSGPQPSAVVTDAELVGNYALRFTWADGHGAGIYVFAALRNSCPCAVCNPAGPPPLLPDD